MSTSVGWSSPAGLVVVVVVVERAWSSEGVVWIVGSSRAEEMVCLGGRVCRGGVVSLGSAGWVGVGEEGPLGVGFWDELAVGVRRRRVSGLEDRFFTGGGGISDG